MIASAYFLLTIFFSFSYSLEVLGIFMIVIMYVNILILAESLRSDGQMLVSISKDGDNRFSYNSMPPQQNWRVKTSFLSR